MFLCCNRIVHSSQSSRHIALRFEVLLVLTNPVKPVGIGMLVNECEMNKRQRWQPFSDLFFDVG